MMTYSNFYFSNPNSTMMETIEFLHDYVMSFMTFFLMVVLMMIIYIFTFMKNFSLNFFEDHQLESIWTIVPFITIIFIATPSIMCLYMTEASQHPGLTVDILGCQWYWKYIYVFGNQKVKFISYIIPTEDTNLSRVMDVDNRLLLPAFLPIRGLITAKDVIHSWTIPSLGVKMDAIPGRINQVNFMSKRAGIFFGQCSEICGANHSFMPICVEFYDIKNYLKIL